MNIQLLIGAIPTTELTQKLKDMETFELTPINRKSFYKKAIVRVDKTDLGTVSRLKSYDTIVASYCHDKNEMKINGYYSPTTMRHINAFLKFYGFDTCSKKELEKNYLNG